MTPLTVITLSLNKRTVSVCVCAVHMTEESRKAYVGGYERNLEEGLRIDFRHCDMYADFGDQVSPTYVYTFDGNDWVESEIDATPPYGMT